jgi:outer membrane protein insertion porin family
MGPLLVWLAFAARAAAPPPVEAIGLPVAQVALEAPEGGLPTENLEPLLRVQPGDPLDLGAVRDDIALLYRAGAFASVEAIAEPWTLLGPDGEPQPAIVLIYRVAPAPRLAELRVDAADRAVERVARAAVGLGAGAVYYPAAEEGLLVSRVRAALVAAGWTDARVDARSTAAGVLRLRVDAGRRARWAGVDIDGTGLGDGLCRGDGCRPSARALRRDLARAGVAPGEPVIGAQLDAAVLSLRQSLVDDGYLQARVGVLQSAGPEGQPRLLVTVDPGPRVVLAVASRRFWRDRHLPGDRELREIVGLYGGEDVNARSAAEAATDLAAWLDRRGHLDARVNGRLVEKEGVRSILLDARAGPRTRLKAVVVDGAAAFPARTLAQAAAEADPIGLGRQVVSAAGVEVARAGMVQLYRGHGFLDARVRTVGIEPRARVGLRPMATVRFAVEEGQQTLLRGLEATAEVPGVDLAAAQAELVGAPYSPSRLDALAAAWTDALRAQGYLYADVTVESRLSADRLAAEAVFDVRPGGQVRLRSVVVQGNQRTRRRVIEREIAVRVGEPITPAALEQTRSGLYALDLFRAVSPELIGDDDRARDLLLLLDEKPNILIEAGGGAATDQGVRARVRATHRNIGGLGHKLTGLAQAGLGWAGEAWRLDTATPVYRSALQYTAPHLVGRTGALRAEALLGETVQQPDFRFLRTGGAVGLAFAPGRWEAVVEYQLQRRRLDDVDLGLLVAGDPWLGPLGLEGAGLGVPRIPSGVRVHAGPSVLVRYDGRDDPLDPRRGGLTSGLLEFTDGLWARPVTARADLRVERYVGLGPLVLDLGARAGAGWAGRGATLPVEERFFLGGSATLRGFQLNSVGPANRSGRPTIAFPSALEPAVEGLGVRERPTRWVPTGGDLLLSLSTELRVPLRLLGVGTTDSASLVLFCDMGRVDFLDPDIRVRSDTLGVDPFLRVGLGSGLRFATPVGPASLDIGVNPWRLPGREEPLLLPHLSLGAF